MARGGSARGKECGIPEPYTAAQFFECLESRHVNDCIERSREVNLTLVTDVLREGDF